MTAQRSVGRITQLQYLLLKYSQFLGANFREIVIGEVRRISLPRIRVNKVGVRPLAPMAVFITWLPCLCNTSVVQIYYVNLTEGGASGRQGKPDGFALHRGARRQGREEGFEAGDVFDADECQGARQAGLVGQQSGRPQDAFRRGTAQGGPGRGYRALRWVGVPRRSRGLHSPGPRRHRV